MAVIQSFHCGSVEVNPTSIYEDAGLITDLALWVKDLCCCELWCRLQTQLGRGIAKAVGQAGSYNSDSTPSLTTSICHRDSHKKKKK